MRHPAKSLPASSDKSDVALDSFTPVELRAVSMAACACTMMGLFAENHNLDITGMDKIVQPPQQLAQLPHQNPLVQAQF